MSSVSKTEKSAPTYAKSSNSRLFKVVTDLSVERCRRDTEDKSIKIKLLLQLLKVSNIFVETDCPLL